MGIKYEVIYKSLHMGELACTINSLSHPRLIIFSKNNNYESASKSHFKTHTQKLTNCPHKPDTTYQPVTSKQSPELVFFMDHTFVNVLIHLCLQRTGCFTSIREALPVWVRPSVSPNQRMRDSIPW